MDHPFNESEFVPTQELILGLECNVLQGLLYHFLGSGQSLQQLDRLLFQLVVQSQLEQGIVDVGLVDDVSGHDVVVQTLLHILVPLQVWPYPQRL